MIGCRGEKWSTPSDRALFDVFVNDVLYTPAFGKTSKVEDIKGKRHQKISKEKDNVS
jgi:hypothetical protein